MTIDPRQNTFDEIDGNKDLLEDYNQKACENFLILSHKINDKKYFRWKILKQMKN